MGDAGLTPDLPPGLPSDDFGMMLQRVPGNCFVVGNGVGQGVGEGGCGVHNASYDFNEKILPGTASLFVTLTQRSLASWVCARRRRVGTGVDHDGKGQIGHHHRHRRTN